MDILTSDNIFMYSFTNVFDITPYADTCIHDVTASACELSLDIIPFRNINDGVVRTCLTLGSE